MTIMAHCQSANCNLDFHGSGSVIYNLSSSLPMCARTCAPARRRSHAPWRRGRWAQPTSSLVPLGAFPHHMLMYIYIYIYIYTYTH